MISFVGIEDGQQFGTKNNIIFSVKSEETGLSKLMFSLDGTTVASKTVSWNEVFDNVNLDLSNIGTGKHSLELTAIDTNQNINSKKITLNLVEKDTTPPFLVKDKSSVLRGEGGFEVSLLFSDAISNVKGGKVFAGESTTPLATFKMQVANFTTDQNIVVVEVEDLYGNILKEPIDLANF